MEPVNTVSEPTCRGLFPNLPLQECLQGCGLCLRFPNLPPRACQPGMQPVYTVSKLTSRGLLARVAACLHGFQTYLQGTVGQGCSLFIWFSSVSPGDCQTMIQPVYMFSEPTSRVLSARFAACLYGFRIYPHEIDGKRISLFIRFLNLPSGDCRQGM